MTSPTPVKARPHPLSVTNAERQMMKVIINNDDDDNIMMIMMQASPPGDRLEPLTPSKHGQVTSYNNVSVFLTSVPQYESSVTPVAGGHPRPRARTLGSAGGAAMAREVRARRQQQQVIRISSVSMIFTYRF